MDQKKLAALEAWGAVFTFVMASMLHFSYQLSGGAVWAILFGSVNESVWEHVKIMAMPYLVWAVLEVGILQPPVKKMVVAKAAGMYGMSLALIGFYYLYSGIVGRSILAVDIISAMLWAALGHVISHKLIRLKFKESSWFSAASFLLALFAAMYLTFSVNPPRWNLFCDPTTGLYGLPPRSYDVGALYLDQQVALSADGEISLPEQ